MATNRPGRRRLILCGICFKESCPLSRWVNEDGDVAELIDEMHIMYLETCHTEEEESESLSAQEKESRIKEVIENNGDIEIENLNELLGSDVKGIEKAIGDFKTDKGSFIDDILRSASEHVENKQDEQKEKGH